jgi:hypothetical protein
VVPFLPYNEVRYWPPHVLSYALGNWLGTWHNRIDIVNIFSYDVNDIKRGMYPSYIVEDGIRIIYKITLWGGDESVSHKFQYNVLNNQKLFEMELFQMKNLNFNDGMPDYDHPDDEVLRNIMLNLYKHRIDPNVVVQVFDNPITWSEIFVSFDLNSFIYQHSANINRTHTIIAIIGIPSGN